MAYGAITQVPTAPGGTAGDPIDSRDGNGLLLRVVTVVGDSSYVTGGRSISAAALGFANAVLYGQGEIYDASATATGTCVCVQPQADGSVKLKCLNNTLVEATAASNQSTATYQLMLWGF